MKLCECGCGREIVVKPHHKYYGIPKFIDGHYFKNKKRTEEYRINLSKSLKGKKKSPRTEEHIKNLSLSLKGRISPMKGKFHTKETKEILRKKSLEQFKNGMPQETKNKLSKLHKGKKFSEETRIKLSAVRQGIPLEEWKKFVSFEPYTLDFNTSFKEMIKKRDNYTCLLCNLFEEDCKLLYKESLSIHHIDYNKLNSFPQNCVSLCKRCNIIVNKNRKQWTLFFQSLLKEIYGYEYTQDQKIILDFTKTQFEKK